MTRYKWLLVWGLFFFQLLGAQGDYVAMFNELTDYETVDKQKVELSAILTERLVLDLRKDVNALDSLGIRQLRAVNSPDGKLALFTWYYALSDATAQYGGVFVYEGRVVPLSYIDRPLEQNKKYTAQEWCGGVCYEIIPVEVKNQTCYTLLSWDGNNGVTYKKIVDVLRFDKKGIAIFGSPLFENNRHTSHRVVIEYSAKTSLLLEYDERVKGIVANALKLNEEFLGEASANYGAGDLFDVYRFESDKWVLYSNVDLTFDREESRSLRNHSTVIEKGL